MNNSIHHNNLSANVYIDYENIYELLQRYKTDPLALNFFPVILEKLRKECDLNIVDCIAYCNFEKRAFNGRTQTLIQQFGIKTRHSANGTKNSSDLLLTVDAMLTLSKYPNIEVFVIISSDRDMIPLLNALKADSKLTYLISTRLGFNAVVSQYADQHEYLEDIFGLTPEMLITTEEKDYQSNIEIAREVSRLFYNSIIWQNHKKTGEPVTLKGYAMIIAKKVNRIPYQIVKDFHLADSLDFVALYEDAEYPDKGICIEKGANYKEVFDANENIG